MRSFLAHSGVLIAAVAVALLEAAARTLGVPLPLAAHVAVGSGTLAVYAFDHLVDDGVAKTRRREFVRAHGHALRRAAGLAFVVAVVAGLRLPARAVWLLGAVVFVALLHARLRRWDWLKPVYVSIAWTTVVVGLPSLLASRPPSAAAAELAPLGLAVLANVFACDAADREAVARRIGPHRAWNLARFTALLGVGSAFLGPPSTQGLAAVPLVTLLALLPYRPTEEHATWMVDGALLLGAVAAILLAN